MYPGVATVIFHHIEIGQWGKLTGINRFYAEVVDLLFARLEINYAWFVGFDPDIVVLVLVAGIKHIADDALAIGFIESRELLLLDVVQKETITTA
jgi:hypothetical protein